MANTKSAQKAQRVSVKRKLVNTRIRSAFKAARKETWDSLTAGKVAQAKKALVKAYSKIDFAVKKGVIHKGTGDRYKSRLALQVKKADQAK